MCSKYFLQNEVCVGERESTKSTVQTKVQVKFSVYNMPMQCTHIYMSEKLKIISCVTTSVDKGLTDLLKAIIVYIVIYIQYFFLRFQKVGCN